MKADPVLRRIDMTATRPSDDRVLAKWLQLSLAAKHQAVQEPLPQALADLLSPAT